MITHPFAAITQFLTKKNLGKSKILGHFGSSIKNMDSIDLRLKASRKNYIFYRLKLVVLILQPPRDRV